MSDPAPSSSGARTVWMYWEQGMAAAPPVVRRCVSSWSALNPGWRVVVLDRDSVGHHLPAFDVDLHRVDISVQKRSNFIRLLLLRRYGGIWADASAFCWTPLDDWLPSVFEQGFFAFRRPGPDRLMSNWFLAARPDSVLLNGLLSRYADVFRGRTFDRHDDPATRRLIKELRAYYSRDPEGTLFWTSSFALDYLRAYPYFIFHYAFNAMILNDAALAQHWAAVPTRAAADCFLIKHSATESSAPEVLRRAVAQGGPVQKLSWRVDLESPFWRTIDDALCRRIESRQG